KVIRLRAYSDAGGANVERNRCILAPSCCRRTYSTEPPLDPAPAGEVLTGLDDPRLALDLWRPLVQVMDDPLDPGHIVLDVPHDERVGPGIDLDFASRAETAFRDVDGLRRIAVIEVD